MIVMLFALSFGSRMSSAMTRGLHALVFRSPRQSDSCPRPCADRRKAPGIKGNDDNRIARLSGGKSKIQVIKQIIKNRSGSKKMMRIRTSVHRMKQAFLSCSSVSSPRTFRRSVYRVPRSISPNCHSAGRCKSAGSDGTPSLSILMDCMVRTILTHSSTETAWGPETSNGLLMTLGFTSLPSCSCGFPLTCTSPSYHIHLGGAVAENGRLIDRAVHTGYGRRHLELEAADLVLYPLTLDHTEPREKFTAVAPSFFSYPERLRWSTRYFPSSGRPITVDDHFDPAGFFRFNHIPWIYFNIR